MRCGRALPMWIKSMPENNTSIQQQPTPAQPKLWMGGSIKSTRADVLKQIAASGLPETHKAVLVEAVGKVDVKFEMLHMVYSRHDHKGGENCGYTITEL